MWSGFIDRNTHGRQKLFVPFIVVETNEDDSIDYIEKIFHYNPYGASCECCGDDYIIKSADTMHEALGISNHEFHSLLDKKKVLIVRYHELKMKRSLIS